MDTIQLEWLQLLCFRVVRIRGLKTNIVSQLVLVAEHIPLAS